MVTIWLYIISYVEYSNINCSSKWKIPDLFSGLREPDYQMFMTTCCRFQLWSLSTPVLWDQMSHLCLSWHPARVLGLLSDALSKGFLLSSQFCLKKLPNRYCAAHTNHVNCCHRGIKLIYLIQGRREEDDVVEKLNLFLDLLQSYRVSIYVL